MFYIKDAQIILKVNPIKTEYIEKLVVSKSINRKIGTLDIDTIVQNGVHKPYLFAFYDGLTNTSSTWFDDNPSGLFNHLLSRRFRGYTIYAHNLSRYEIVFLFKYLSAIKSQGFKVDVVKKRRQNHFYQNL